MASSEGKRGRLTSSGDFKRAYRSGRSRTNRYLIVYTFPSSGEGGEGGPRLGISVGRKVGNAVERNRVKRILREAFWNLDHTDGATDVVIVARPDVSELVDRSPGAVASAIAELLPDQPNSPGPEGQESLETAAEAENDATSEESGRST